MFKILIILEQFSKQNIMNVFCAKTIKKFGCYKVFLMNIVVVINGQFDGLGVDTNLV